MGDLEKTTKIKRGNLLMSNLKEQIYLYSISTDGFYNEEENAIHNRLMRCYVCRNRLKKYEVNVERRMRFISEHINELKKELDELLEENEDMRILREDAFKDTNKISQFMSTLTRTLELEDKETTKDIVIVRAYHYKVLENLIHKGFVNEDGEHFKYFASSAGMIRNKKSVFIKKSVMEDETFHNRIWCGIDKERINNKKFEDKEGNEEYGININKMNAYLALCMTSSIPFKDFDIDRAIVVKDFETVLKNQTVDYIDEKTFKPERKHNKSITINHLDGAGIMLPEVREKSLQFRMPHFKGLLIPFPFDDFITDKMRKDDVTVTDIYGEEWDIIAQDIQYIFTESQFKLAKYYNNWGEYKSAFKKGCEFVICKEEESKFPDKPTNYQMLQTLDDMSAKELKILAKKTNKDIAETGQSKEVMTRILGVNKEEDDKNEFQKALTIYPELLNDQHSKEAVRNTRDSLYKDAKAGRLLLEGSKRTFIAPDLYAFCECLFEGIDEPVGLLKNGEVSCQLYDNKKTLDVLRSPHLYKEHAIRENVRNTNTRKWFDTNCIYTSIHDPISKVLMFDVDGDEAHIISNSTYTYIAKRNMEGIVPLDYDLPTAKKEKISEESIYNSLIAAYSKNIGEVSNSISKIFNLPHNKIDLDTVKQLCFINNAIIDYAKTLWMPEVPEEVKARINELTEGKLPHFFIHAKDKTEDQVEPLIHNEIFDTMPEKDQQIYLEHITTVNKLEYIIKKKRIHFSKVVDDFDYRFLMKKKKVKKKDQQVINKYNEINRAKKTFIRKQMELQDVNNKTRLNVYDEIRKALLEINNDEDTVVDMLIEYVYTEKPDSKKSTLWKSFGDVLFRNLEENLGSEAWICEDCECMFRKVTKNKVVCDKCKKKRDREEDRKRKIMSRNKLRTENGKTA
ncbi:hypothetical protein [Halobacillus sp. A5]|uniref:hypothetical protein n=1 Tax=Halobacillus sp. A5 TaxID=2880263 RepID=UPI0020A6A257|nr:hypothetical protein [Halobacillus sp. A5]MCP3026016.1 hypothetical protein [Halobacillus sp. A5]